MRTVGEILKKARLEKKLTREDIAKETKINATYLKAIERNDFNNLPPSAFTKGFLRNYAKVVDLNPQNVLAIFRRDYDQDEKGRIIPRGLAKPSKTKINIFHPSTTTTISSAIMAIIVLAFFIRQIIVFNSAPPLTIAAPAENIEIQSPVQVIGSTDPEASATINNQPVAVDDAGNFSAEINLSPGNHTLVISVKSRSNRIETKQRSIIVSQ